MFRLFNRYNSSIRFARHSSQNGGNKPNKNRNLAMYLTAGTLGMLGLAYLAVPLYRMFCQTTGFGGTTHQAEKGNRYKIDKSKEMTVQFAGQVVEGLPWTFEPAQTHIDLYPGEVALAFYSTTNYSDEPIIGISTYGVSPPQAGFYFEKIECFCFDEQRVGPHETVMMPLLFVLNPDLVKAKNMQDVYTITLSYTFFEATDQNIYDPMTGQIVDPKDYASPKDYSTQLPTHRKDQ